MKRATLGLAVVCSALVLGCGSSPSTETGITPETTKGPNWGDNLTKSPNLSLMKMKTPQERADYLRGLAKDSKFDPKPYADTFEKYAKDPDPEVAAAAKELADRAH